MYPPRPSPPPPRLAGCGAKAQLLRGEAWGHDRPLCTPKERPRLSPGAGGGVSAGVQGYVGVAQTHQRAAPPQCIHTPAHTHQPRTPEPQGERRWLAKGSRPWGVAEWWRCLAGSGQMHVQSDTRVQTWAHTCTHVCTCSLTDARVFAQMGTCATMHTTCANRRAHTHTVCNGDQASGPTLPPPCQGPALCPPRGLGAVSLSSGDAGSPRPLPFGTTSTRVRPQNRARTVQPASLVGTGSPRPVPG